MPSQRFIQALNEQIRYELSAHQQYVAIAVHYEAQALPQLATLFYRQALEERNHALMMVQYLLDNDCASRVPGAEEPQNEFGDIVAPVRLALEQERRVRDEIARLASIAREEDDYTSEQFMQWFIKEQVEEISKMSTLLQIVERERERPMEIEEYIVREGLATQEADPTAPRVAGGAL